MVPSTSKIQILELVNENKKLKDRIDRLKETLIDLHNQYAAMTDHAAKRQGAHLDQREGDVYHEMQALKSVYGLKRRTTKTIMGLTGQEIKGS